MTAVVEFNLQTGRPVCMSFTLEGRGEYYVKLPFPSNVNLKKERQVSIFFNFEGHGDTITLNVSCGVEVGRKKAKEISRAIISDTAIATAVHYLSSIDSSLCNQFVIMVNYGVVMLLGVVPLIPGSTTSIPMSPGYGGPELLHQSARYYTSTYAAPAYYTDAPNYYSVPSYYTEAPVYYTTKAIEYYTEVPKYYTAIYVARAYTTKGPEYCTTTYTAPYYNEPEYYIDAPVYYTTTYVTPRCYTEASKYCTGKAEYYTTTFAAPVYYGEKLQYFSAPINYRTEAPVHYTIYAPGFYSTTYAAPIYTAGPHNQGTRATT
ncbi:hypothetical protein DAPPUDRAFT_235674 [Daphnia pulex]|uniref:Uncharacterized protein n=1 Tax=Daphnia pulex TaxID=6669 RepID=E9G0I3_DAPPU|nr:hypothetical protein DAPPUDRAFT_235674 [Daphnia pulex]|eukprot:EFX86909.1 hypothetical protein DAPPUDRAFT_235674 [Daphnia pulex]